MKHIFMVKFSTINLSSEFLYCQILCTCLISLSNCDTHLIWINTKYVSLCLNLSQCNVYSLCHALLAVPAVPLGLPLQVEHAWPRCVAVALGGLGEHGDHHEVHGDQDDRFEEHGDADRCGKSMVKRKLSIFIYAWHNTCL